MKELADILQAYPQFAGSPLAMATVVRVQGSAYRRPGARMLITNDGHAIGGVSGGCLERDVIQRAGAAMLSKEPALVRYDTTLEAEGGSGYTLGCGGAIDVLIESLGTPQGIKLMEWIQASRSQRLVVATAITRRHPSIPLGQRMMIDETRSTEGQIGTLDFSKAIADDATQLLVQGRSIIKQYSTPGGAIEIFFEVLEPALNLFIFGAGSDAVPLIDFSKSLGWNVTLVDVRSSPMDPGRIWAADQVIRCSVDAVNERVSIPPASAVVVMTHNFLHDWRIIRWLSDLSLRYLGLLGPRHRTEQVLGDLSGDSIHSPVGLDIGADNPQEVALSIVAEITAVLRGRSGRSLRNTSGPIHVGSPYQRMIASCPVAAS